MPVSTPKLGNQKPVKKFTKKSKKQEKRILTT